MNNRTYSVVVAEDERMILRNVVGKIEGMDMGFYVVGTATNGIDALRLAQTMKPDVLVTDIKMPLLTGMQLIQEIRKDNKGMKIILLSGFNDFSYAQQAIVQGVEAYLLKPLDKEELRKVLARLEQSLTESRLSGQREALEFAIRGVPLEKEPPMDRKIQYFSLFLINIGNLAWNTISLKYMEYIQKLWEGICWEELPSCPAEDGSPFWVIDDKNINQKFFIRGYEKRVTAAQVREEEQALLGELQDKIREIPVHICSGEVPVTYQEIQAAAHKLRARLDKNLVIGRCVVQDRITTMSEDSRWAAGAVGKKLLTSIKKGSATALRQDIMELFDDMDWAGLGQRQVEKVLLYILNFLREHGQFDAEQDTVSLEFQLREKMFFMRGMQEMKKMVLDMIEANRTPEGGEENVGALVSRVEAYIDRHYAEELTIEELSRIFHFNGTYLTRVFKKQTGEAPLKYIIGVRMRKAMELMETQKDLDLKQIAELVGYENSHYFSRLFKNRTGKTPSEYRSEL